MLVRVPNSSPGATQDSRGGVDLAIGGDAILLAGAGRASLNGVGVQAEVALLATIVVVVVVVVVAAIVVVVVIPTILAIALVLVLPAKECPLDGGPVHDGGVGDGNQSQEADQDVLDQHVCGFLFDMPKERGEVRGGCSKDLSAFGAEEKRSREFAKMVPDLFERKKKSNGRGRKSQEDESSLFYEVNKHWLMEKERMKVVWTHYQRCKQEKKGTEKKDGRRKRRREGRVTDGERREGG